MNVTHFEETSFIGFDTLSKVWIYPSVDILPEKVVEEITLLLKDFTHNWTAHNNALKASGVVLYNRFIVLVVDETQSTASGCSIDKSVNFIKNLEAKYGLNLFDRLRIFYQENNEMKDFHLSDLKDMLALNKLSMNTKVYDSTITNLGDFQKDFSKELQDSWLKRFI